MKVCGDHAPTGWVSSLGIIVIFRQHSLAGIDRFGLNLSDAKKCVCFFRRLQGSLLFDRICSIFTAKRFIPLKRLRDMHALSIFVWKWDTPLFHICFPIPSTGLSCFPFKWRDRRETTWIRSDDQPRHHLHFPRLRFSVEGVGHYPRSDGLWAYSIHKMWKTIICFFQKETH